MRDKVTHSSMIAEWGSRQNEHRYNNDPEKGRVVCSNQHIKRKAVDSDCESTFAFAGQMLVMNDVIDVRWHSHDSCTLWYTLLSTVCGAPLPKRPLHPIGASANSHGAEEER